VPVLGQAADESILDAMALCEALFDMPSLNLRDIQQAFNRYRKERTSRRETAIDEARSLDQILNAKVKKKNKKKKKPDHPNSSFSHPHWEFLQHLTLALGEFLLAVSLSQKI